MIKEEKIKHSYPHCWRCKKPVIFRATEQWFISMQKNEYERKSPFRDRQGSMGPEMGDVRGYRGWSQTDPTGVLQRQRSWGVPITILKCTECEEFVTDHEVLSKIVELVEVI